MHVPSMTSDSFTGTSHFVPGRDRTMTGGSDATLKKADADADVRASPASTTLESQMATVTTRP